MDHLLFHSAAEVVIVKREKGFKEKTKSGIEIEYDGDDNDIEPAVQARVAEMTEAADAEDDACRVNFRWGREQVQLVKAAAAKMGVPYQTYIKQVVTRQALADMQAFKALEVNEGIEGSLPRESSGTATSAQRSAG